MYIYVCVCGCVWVCVGVWVYACVFVCACVRVCVRHSRDDEKVTPPSQILPRLARLLETLRRVGLPVCDAPGM